LQKAENSFSPKKQNARILVATLQIDALSE